MGRSSVWENGIRADTTRGLASSHPDELGDRARTHVRSAYAAVSASMTSGDLSTSDTALLKATAAIGLDRARVLFARVEKAFEGLA